MAEPILSRKRDLVYLLYFCTAIPMAFIMDIQPLYPPSRIPSWMTNLSDFYIDTYQDQFFINPPPFFELFLWSELFIQLPVMLWSLPALYRGSSKLPLVLFPFSCLIFMTTATCMWEFWHWDVAAEVKINLTTLYGPYLTLSGLMMVDMYLRLSSLINRSSVVSRSQTKKEL